MLHVKDVLHLFAKGALDRSPNINAKYTEETGIDLEADIFKLV